MGAGRTAEGLVSRLTSAIGAARLGLAAVLTALALNALFLLLNLQATELPRERVRNEVARAFASGELVERDYLHDDWHRGSHQYNDCVILQLIGNRARSPIEQALAPPMYTLHGADTEMCRSLRQVSAAGAPDARFNEDRYARYWHGYMPVTAALLSFSDIGTARQLLRLLVIAALAALIAAAARAHGPLRVAGLAVGATGLLFWGLPYYGQSFAHAQGDALLIAALAALIAWRRRLAKPPALILAAAAFGSLVAYLDFLIGQLPIAASLLFFFVFLIAREQEAAAPFTRAFAALAAFALGAIVTVAVKQLLVALLVAPGAFGRLEENFLIYTGLAGGSQPWPLIYAKAVFNLFKFTPILTYYSIGLGVILLAAFAASWLAALVLAVRSADPVRRQIFAAHLIAALGIAAWIALLPEHTRIHAGFMVRMLLVPLALGWSAMATQMLPISPQNRAGA